MAVVAAMAATPTTSLDAQTNRAHLGPRLTYNFDAELFGIGAQLGVPIARQLEFYPSFDIYFPESGSMWALNADLKYRITTDRSADWLYVGGGVNITGLDRGSADRTKAGANILFGVEPLRGRVSSRVSPVRMPTSYSRSRGSSSAVRPVAFSRKAAVSRARARSLLTSSAGCSSATTRAMSSAC
jgi:hypothetical protein